MPPRGKPSSASIGKGGRAASCSCASSCPKGASCPTWRRTAPTWKRNSITSIRISRAEKANGTSAMVGPSSASPAQEFEDEVQGGVARLGRRVSAQEEGAARRIGHDAGRERLEGGERDVPMDPEAEGGFTFLFRTRGDFEGRHLSHHVGRLSIELAHGAEDRVERDEPRSERLRAPDDRVIRERGPPRLIGRPSGNPGQEDFAPAVDGVDHVQIDRVLVRLRGGRPDRRVVPAKVLVIQARVETLRDGFRRVPGPGHRPVEPVVELHERSFRGSVPGFRGSHGVARYAARARAWAWNFSASRTSSGILWAMSRKCSMNSTYSSYEKSGSPPPSGANPVRTIFDCPTGSMPSCCSVRTQLRKYAALSMLTPAILPPRIWDRVCGTKTRSKASA